MLASFLPVQTMLYQSLFLLMAIAIEGFILHRQLQLSRKTSIQYATSINLISTVVGWLVFFFVQPLLPINIKIQLISYIFFNRFLTSAANFSSFWLTILFIFSFLISFLIKLQGVKSLDSLLMESNSISQILVKLTSLRYNKKKSTHLYSTKHRSKPTAILLANAYSHSAMLLILTLRYFI
ncbi:MAG: filament integrity protein FraC [Crinalium sp.]